MNLQEEQFLIEFEEMGYTVLRSGWPDFLISKGGVAAGVELKGKHDIVKLNQQQMMDALSAAGIKCFVGHWKWHEITNYMEMAGRDDDILKKINERYMRKLRGIMARLETTKELIENFRWSVSKYRRTNRRQRKLDEIVDRLDLIIKDIETPPTKMLKQWFERVSS